MCGDYLCTLYAKQKHLGCKKLGGQSEAAVNDYWGPNTLKYSNYGQELGRVKRYTQL